MSEHRLSCAISIAYTEKDYTTGKHYGMGVTTAIPRLAKHALCFSMLFWRRTCPPSATL